MPRESFRGGETTPTREVWYIGPESGIYHTRRDCAGLNNAYRYWSIKSAPSVDELPPSGDYRNRGQGRRLCKACERAS